MRPLSEANINQEDQIAEALLVCENLPDDLWDEFDNWKGIRYTTITKFQEIKKVLDEVQNRGLFVKVAASAGTLVAGGAGGAAIGAVAAVAIPFLIPILISSSATSLVLLGGSLTKFLQHKGINEEQLSSFKDILTTDQKLANSIMNRLTAIARSTLHEKFAETIRKCSSDLNSSLDDNAGANSDFQEIDTVPKLVKYIDDVIQKLEIQSKLITMIMIIATLQKLKIKLKTN